MDEEIKAIKECFEKIRGGIIAIRKKKGEERDELEKKIEDIFNDCKNHIKKYEKLYTDLKKNHELIASNQKEWDTQVRKNKKKLKKFAKDFKAKKKVFKAALEESRKNELLVLADDNEEENEKKRIREKIKNKEELSNDELSHQLFKDVYQIQDENLELVNALLDKADKAKELGADIAEDILEQNEIIRNISADLDTLSGTIQRATKEVTSFMRGVATDKMIIVCLLFCVGITCIAVALFVICQCYVCHLICDAIGQAEKCKKIPGIYN